MKPVSPPRSRQLDRAQDAAAVDLGRCRSGRCATAARRRAPRRRPHRSPARRCRRCRSARGRLARYVLDHLMVLQLAEDPAEADVHVRGLLQPAKDDDAGIDPQLAQRSPGLPDRRCRPASTRSRPRRTQPGPAAAKSRNPWLLSRGGRHRSWPTAGDYRETAFDTAVNSPPRISAAVSQCVEARPWLASPATNGNAAPPEISGSQGMDRRSFIAALPAARLVHRRSDRAV